MKLVQADEPQVRSWYNFISGVCKSGFVVLQPRPINENCAKIRFLIFTLKPGVHLSKKSHFEIIIAKYFAINYAAAIGSYRKLSRKVNLA